MGGFYLNDGESIPSTTQAFSVRLSTRHRNRRITVKETMAVLHVLQKWKHEFENTRLIIQGDNTGKRAQELFDTRSSLRPFVRRGYDIGIVRHCY